VQQLVFGGFVYGGSVRGLLRIIGRTAVGLSAVLCVALAGMWVGSYWKTLGWGRSYFVGEEQSLLSWHVGSQRGKVGVMRWRLRFEEGSGVKVKEEGDGVGTAYVPRLMAFRYQDRWAEQKVDFAEKPERWWEHAGVYVRRSEEPTGPVPQVIAPSSVMVMVPYWLLVVVSGIGPGVWVIRWWRRRRRVREGCCMKCGYDLRASEGRCPECGEVNQPVVK
jgi:hypothetical protein